MSSFEIPGVLTPSQKTLIRSWWKKVTIANPKAQNFKDMKVVSVENGVFGIPLITSVKYAGSTISYIDGHTGVQCFGVIPTIIAKCGSFLKEEGLRVEGIFRLPGSCRRLRILQTIFDSPGTYGSDLDWRGYTIHDAASILKRFLVQLPEPLIPIQYYQSFKDTLDHDFPTMDDKLDAFQVLIEKLPLPHQYLLLYLLDMLALFSTTSDSTKMSTQCLACVFVPGILYHPTTSKNPAAYKHSQQVLQFLIEHQQSFNMPHQPSTITSDQRFLSNFIPPIKPITSPPSSTLSPCSTPPPPPSLHRPPSPSNHNHHNNMMLMINNNNNNNN
ncbi:Rho GTPase activation protein, partial [Cunninghamella echinulata]